MEIAIPALLRIKPGALKKIGKYLRNAGYKKIGLFYGEGIREIVEPTVSVSLESSEITIVHEEVVTDNRIEDVFKSAFSVPQGIDALVAVGGGKAVDFCKYIAFIGHLPIVAIPTSLSNDGFCSPLSSLYVNGKRRSLKTRIPDGIIVDTDVIRSAPKRFLYSGLGDLLSNITAVRDWKAAFYEEGVQVNDFAVLVAMQAVDNIVNSPSLNLDNTEFLKALAGGLVMSGVAMEISGSSRPSSGSDHLISHAYDLIAEPPTLHGVQVGVATYGVSLLQENRSEEIKKVMEGSGFGDFVRANPLNRKSFIKSIEAAPEVKLNFWSVLSERAAREKLIDLVKTDEYYKKFFA